MFCKKNPQRTRGAEFFLGFFCIIFDRYVTWGPEIFRVFWIFPLSYLAAGKTQKILYANRRIFLVMFLKKNLFYCFGAGFCLLGLDFFFHSK